MHSKQFYSLMNQYYSIRIKILSQTTPAEKQLLITLVTNSLEIESDRK